MKLNRNALRNIIIQEMNDMKEDSLRRHYDDKDRETHRISRKSKTCGECGSAMYESDSVCEACGNMYEKETSLNEGGCGCGESSSKDDGSDYSIDTMGMIGDALGVLTHAGYDVDATKGGHRSHNNYMANHPLGDYSNLNNTNITPEQAFDAGYEVSGIDDDNHRKHNNYMAKPSLYKVAKYAQKLLHMIPDGYELDDWQRTKIAQLADDISEVYHSLDYDKFEGDL